MQQFSHLADAVTERLFQRRAHSFKYSDDADSVAHGLGATLYMPATRTDLAAQLSGFAHSGLTAAVICLEDAVRDGEVGLAEARVVACLTELAHHMDVTAPATFVRVRSAAQATEIVRQVGTEHEALAGFVYPKFAGAHAASFVDTHQAVVAQLGRPLWMMPILETPEIARPDGRLALLRSLREQLDEVREHVLAVRIGLTDIAGEYGLRRPRDLTAYDLPLLAGAVGDIVGVFGAGDHPYAVSGGVWEHFPRAERLWKPQLRESPFRRRRSPALRADLLSRDLDGLIREAHLDRVQGLVGKSVIHPSHVPVVNAMSVVSHEEYVDACSVLGPGLSSGGVEASPLRNKMNEGHPHRRWAHRIMRRATAFGVARPDVGYVDLLAASLRG